MVVGHAAEIRRELVIFQLMIKFKLLELNIIFCSMDAVTLDLSGLGGG